MLRKICDYAGLTPVALRHSILHTEITAPGVA